MSPTERWAVCWDDEQGTISNSMRPPPLPVVNEGDETALVSQESLQDIAEEDVAPKEKIDSSPSKQSSQSTCSPTPPTSTNDVQEEPAKDDKKSEEELDRGQIFIYVAEKASRDEVAPEEEPEGNASRETEPVTPSLEQEERISHELNTGATEGDQMALDHSSHASGNGISRGTSADTSDAEDATDRGESTPDSSESRAAKRKLGEIDTTESSLESSSAELHASDDVVGDTIVVSRTSRTKQTYATKKRRHIAPAPTGSGNTREPVTPSDGSHSSVTPSERASSKRRSVQSQEPLSPGEHIGPPPIVVFSSATTVDGKKAIMRTFSRLGGKVSTKITEATVLCVPDGHLKKTGKLVMAVALGIDIVTEAWVEDTHQTRRFPALENYLPSATSSEREWGTTLKDAINRGKAGLTNLLSGVTVHFTKQLWKDLGNLGREFSQIATIIGADKVQHRLPSHQKDKEELEDSEVLVIGVPNDPQGALVAKLGYKMFNKDFITMAALRGRVEPEQAEFVIEVPIKDEDDE